MVKKVKSDLKFFYTQCGEWDAVVSAASPLEACRDAITESKTKLGKDQKMGNIVLAMDVREEVEKQNGSSISVFQVNGLEDNHEY